MQRFVSNLVSGMGVTDVIDILIVAFVVYKILGFIRESRAEQLVKGLLLLVIGTFVSQLLHLYTLNWILKATMTLGVIALVIVFQPELRRGLEQMGRSKIVRPNFFRMDKEKGKNITAQFVEAIDEMSSKKEGLLLVIERQTSLADISETGTVLDAEISAELIRNIFYDGSPLHDGAVIVRGSKLHAAGCVLPLTENKELPAGLGTRHRAGIGITERSDAVVFIVSEETGIISMAENGKLERFLDEKRVEKALLGIYLYTDQQEVFPRLRSILRRLGGKKHV